MKTPAQARAILRKLEAQHPGAQTELHFSGPFQLLVATILSAQTTDDRVNQVTPDLFARYPDAAALAGARIQDVERLIHPTGFYAQKARSLLGMAGRLVERHGGAVPAEMAALVQLPGVGRKTANVVLGHALGVPGLAVDRHVLRVTNRIGLAASADPEVVEQQLCAALPKDEWTVASDTLILHGRRVCKPHPLCDRCSARPDCDFYRSGTAILARTGPAAPPRPAPGKTAKKPAAKKPAGKSSTSTKPRRRVRPPSRRGR
jgi:endonuclease-3